MKKRLLSLMLCLIMCLSLMPTVAFSVAVLPIENVEITVPNPITTQTAGENIAAIKNTLGCDLSATWYSVSDAREMSANEKFKAENQYYLNIELTATSSSEVAYYFPITVRRNVYTAKTDVLINGGSVTATVRVDTNSVSSTNTNARKLTVRSGNFTAKQPVTVSTIDIIGLQTPCAEQKASDNLVDLRVADESYSTIIFAKWQDVTTNNYLNENDTFVAGHSYYLDVVVAPDAGTSYTASPVCRFNRDSNLWNAASGIGTGSYNGGIYVEFYSVTMTVKGSPSGNNYVKNIHWGTGANAKVLYWDPVDGAAKYSVSVATTGISGGGNIKPESTFYDASSTVRTTGTYETRVWAYDSNNNVIADSVGPTKYFEVISLGTPTNIAVDTTSGMITWDRVANADKYTVYLITEGGTSAGLKFTDVNSIQLGEFNIRPDVSYYVEITANDTTNRYGDSAKAQSEVFTYTPVLDVTNIRWGTGADDAKTIYWDAVPGATRYYVGTGIEANTAGGWVDSSLTSYNAASHISKTGTYTPYVTAYKGDVKLTSDTAGQTKHFTVTPLDTPSNIRVDLDRRILTWNAVDNATSYTIMLLYYDSVYDSDFAIEDIQNVDVSGTAQSVETNSISLDRFVYLDGVHDVPNKLMFVVAAYDSTGNYGSSALGKGSVFTFAYRYAVNASVSDSKGGSVFVQTEQKQADGSVDAVASTYVDKGRRAFITVTCQKGYVVDSVKVNGTDVTSSFYSRGFNQRLYTIENVQTNQNVVVTFSTCRHEWGSGTITTPATCGAAGVRTYTCSNCGETKTETIPATGNHSWDGGAVTKAPTCNATGLMTYTCTVCGHTRTEPLPKIGEHVYGEYATTRPSTCDVPGIETRECTICGAKDERTIAVIPHTPVSSNNAVAATCETAGKESDTQCSVCGQKLTTGAEISATGHAYGEWTYYSATHHVRVCANDPSHIEYDYHRFGGDQTCEVCGSKIGTLVIAGQPAAANCGEEVEVYLEVNDTPGFTSGAVTVSWDSSAMTLTKIEYGLMENNNTSTTITQGSMKISFGGETAAENCDDIGTLLKLVFQVAEHNAVGNQTITVSADSEDFHRAGIDTVFVRTTPATVTVTCVDHIWDEGVVTKAATCTTDGEKTYTCTCCGETKTEVIPRLGHDVVIQPAVEATCTSTGLTEGSYCSRCDTTFARQTVVERKEHTRVEDAYKAPTCTEEGLTQGFHCGVCGEVLAPQRVIDKLPHAIKTDYGYPATCVSTGLTNGSHCKNCGQVLVEQEVIPIDPTAHTAIVIDHSVAATCTTTGLTEGKHCEACNTVIKAQEVIPAKGITCDLTGDGKTDSADLTALLRHVAKIELITDSAMLERANVDGIGSVDAADVTLLAKSLSK